MYLDTHTETQMHFWEPCIKTRPSQCDFSRRDADEDLSCVRVCMGIGRTQFDYISSQISLCLAVLWPFLKRRIQGAENEAEEPYQQETLGKVGEEQN